jgi:hypothetical protein
MLFTEVVEMNCSLYFNVTDISWVECTESLGIPRRRWVNNIKMDLRKIGWGVVDWIKLAQVGTSGGIL